MRPSSEMSYFYSQIGLEDTFFTSLQNCKLQHAAGNAQLCLLVPEKILVACAQQSAQVSVQVPSSGSCRQKNNKFRAGHFRYFEFVQ